MNELPRPGDQVIVRWGPSRVAAEVVRAHHTSRGGLVTVEVLFEGAHEPATFTFFLDDVEPAPAA